MLKTQRDPIFPIIPTTDEVRTPERLVKWWKGLLTVVKNLIEDIHFDLSRLENLPTYANNAAALAGGLAKGDFYRTNGDPDTVCVVH